MGYNNVKQAQPRQVCATANASEDTTLIGSANLNQAYRIANLTDNQIELNEFTNNISVTARSQVDNDTVILELWGYPDKGDAEFLGVYTGTTDEAVSDDGYFYVDTWTETTASQHTAAVISDMSDGISTLKFDSMGFKHIVALVTGITSTDADGIAKVFIRPY